MSWAVLQEVCAGAVNGEDECNGDEWYLLGYSTATTIIMSDLFLFR